MLNYIADGYTEEGYVREVPGQLGEFRFKFRPMLIEDRSILVGSKVQSMADDEQERLMAKAIAARVVSWSLLDAAGKPVAVSPDAVRRLRPALFRKVFSIIAGSEPSDIDPLWTDARKQEQIDDRLQAAMDGRPITDIRSERDAKNFEPASPSSPTTPK